MLVEIEREAAGRRLRLDWSGDTVHWLFARTSGQQWNHDDLASFEPFEGPLPVVLPAPGTAMIGLDWEPRIETVAGRDFEAFLEGRLAGPLLPDDWRRHVEAETVRVRRWESAKLIVRVEGSGPLPPSATAQSKSGQRAEIRFLADPTYTPIGSDLPLRVYLPFARAGARVFAHRIGGEAVSDFATGEEGIGFLTLTRPGVWMVEVHAARLARGAEAEWEVFTASARFETPVNERREEEK